MEIFSLRECRVPHFPWADVSVLGRGSKTWQLAFILVPMLVFTKCPLPPHHGLWQFASEVSFVQGPLKTWKPFLSCFHAMPIGSGVLLSLLSTGTTRTLGGWRWSPRPGHNAQPFPPWVSGAPPAGGQPSRYAHSSSLRCLYLALSLLGLLVSSFLHPRGYISVTWDGGGGSLLPFKEPRPPFHSHKDKGFGKINTKNTHIFLLSVMLDPLQGNKPMTALFK